MTSPTILPPFARPRPLTSLVASAKRLTSSSMRGRIGAGAKSWQEDAWEMYDLVGEQRFLASTLAGRLSQAHLYVGKVTDDSTETPVPVEDKRVTSVLDAIGTSASARAQLIRRLGVNLFVAGDGWMAGIPKTMFPTSMQTNPPAVPVVAPLSDSLPIDLSTLALTDLEWRMFSVSEVTSNSSGEVTLTMGDAEDEKITCSPDNIFLIRVWRPHPRRWWQADSPTRSSLPVLRELVGLTMHISAQVDSRLAGAGLLIVPQSAQRALQVAAGLTEEDDADQFTEALMEAMLAPISDRANASALVPLVVTVPDEVTGMFNFLTFAKPLDSEARSLRDEAIRRLALGQDCPPELLLGTAGMNHWGAWLVQEDTVTTHLEPPLALICDALTSQYLWPVLIDQGMTTEEAHSYVIWYDVSDLVVRPTRAADAMNLHQRGVLSDAALRDVAGFDAADAPVTATLPTEVVMALEMAKASPALVANPGLPALVAQIRAVLLNQIPAVVDPVADKNIKPTSDVAPLPGEPPSTPEPTGPPTAPASPGSPVAGPPTAGPAPAAIPSLRDEEAQGWHENPPDAVYPEDLDPVVPGWSFTPDMAPI